MQIWRLPSISLEKSNEISTIAEAVILEKFAEEVETVVGSAVVARELIQAGYLIQVFADLTLVDNEPGRFKWSSSRGPDGLVTVGTTTTARVAVERHRPISFVFPLLKSAAGID